MKNEILEKVLNAHKNLIITGDVASGKTTNVLFPIVDNAINKKESLFILDSREEYINKYYDKLKENNYNIVILNLRDMDTFKILALDIETGRREYDSKKISELYEKKVGHEEYCTYWNDGCRKNYCRQKIVSMSEGFFFH